MKDQKGFGAIELLLIVAVVLAVAGIGTYVLTKNHSGGSLLGSSKAPTAVTYNGSANTSAPNGIPAGTTAGGNSSASGSAAGQNVIKITAAGFSITVPDSIKDLTYHVGTSGSTTTVTFSTASLSAAVPNCSAPNGNGAFDTIVRGSGVYQANPSGGLIKQYSGYYLAYVLPTGPCAKGLSPANQSLLDAQAQDFYGSLSSVASL